MATNAEKNVKRGKSGTRGAAGTASQRATKSGSIRGRSSAAEGAQKRTSQKKLPDSQGR